MEYKKKNRNISQRLSYSLWRSTSSLALGARALWSGVIIALSMSKNDDFAKTVIQFVAQHLLAYVSRAAS